MPQVKNTILFLIVNFGGLALGNWLMQNGPQTIWYQNLEKAPWTPPGWVFGLAWTLIMICFSGYLGKQFLAKNAKKISLFFSFQFVLNVSWNYLFFNQHLVFLAFICILLLTALLFYYFFKLSDTLGNYRYLLVPYIIWLCIASSLNLYILVNN